MTKDDLRKRLSRSRRIARLYRKALKEIAFLYSGKVVYSGKVNFSWHASSNIAAKALMKADKRK